MKTSRAFALVERLEGLLYENGLQGPYAIYIFRGFPGVGGGIGSSGATASTKNVEDHLRAKGLVTGHDFEWITPLTLKILQSRVDRDLLDSIQSSGGFEHHTPEPRTEHAEENESLTEFPPGSGIPLPAIAGTVAAALYAVHRKKRK